MTTAIVARLKTGTVSNVVAYGQSSTLPQPPYVVVRMEPGTNQTRMARVIAHFSPGQNIFLEDYIFDELTDLLSDWEGTDRNGNSFVLFTEEGYGDIIADNDDGTISAERLFSAPQRMY